MKREKDKVSGEKVRGDQGEGQRREEGEYKEMGWAIFTC